MDKLSVICVIAASVYLNCGQCHMCKYVIKDSPSTIKVDNNLNINETIFSFVLLHANDNNIVIDKFLVRDDTKPERNIFFGTNPIGLLYPYISEIIVRSCPPTNIIETFYLTIQNDFQCKYTVSVKVSAAIPDFRIQPWVEINVSQTNYSVSVLQFQLNDMRVCAHFVCSVEALNSNKLFTIEPKTLNGTFKIETTPDYIRFGFKYALQIVCSVPGSTISDKNRAKVYVIFKNKLKQTSVASKMPTDSLYYQTETSYLSTELTYVKTETIISTTESAYQETKPKNISNGYGHNEANMTILSTGLTHYQTKQNLSTISRLFETSTHLLANISTTVLGLKKSSLKIISKPYKAIHKSSKINEVITYNITSNPLRSEETSKHIETAVRSAPKTILSNVSSPLLNGIVSIGYHSSYKSPEDANNTHVLDTLVTLVSVSTAAGVVGLSTAGVMMYRALRQRRRRRISSVVRQVAADESRGEPGSRDLSQLSCQ